MLEIKETEKIEVRERSRWVGVLSRGQSGSGEE